MSRYIEDFIPPIKEDGIVTAKAISTTSTVTATGGFVGAVSGAVSATTLTASGQVRVPQPVLQQTITTIDAQNGTLTAASLLGGVVKHNSKTGGGTVTLDTGALISAAIPGVAVGTTIRCLYYNYGNQTATITTAASGTTIVGGTAAVTTGKHSEIILVNTAADTWDVYLQTLM